MVLFVLVIAFVTGCHKPCTFSGNDAGSYTLRDYNGVNTGSTDPKDWTNDGNWNTCENNLFNFADTFNYSALTANSALVIAEYPNPFISQLIFLDSCTGTMAVKLVLVDQGMNVKAQVAYTNATGQHPRAFSFTSLDSTASYRLYYRFYGTNKTVLYQGHGDLKVGS
jgi:hypothetical protein